MSNVIHTKWKQVRTLTADPGVYVLCDLDNTPLYVGRGIAERGIRQRVQRHLTSARSDMVANRGIDIWEIAYVWAFPLRQGYSDLAERKAAVNQREINIYTMLSADHHLLNFQEVSGTPTPGFTATPVQQVQIIDDEELERRKIPPNRMLRQLQHLHRLADHMVHVKNSEELQLALKRHLERAVRLTENVLDIPDAI